MAIYPVQVSSLNNNYKNQVSFQSRAGKLKTGIFAGLLALSPLSAKGQVYTHGGEKILARDTVELLGKQKAEVLFIDTDGNHNNFEKIAYSTLRKFNSKHKILKGREGYMQEWSTQYVDTLVRQLVRDDVNGTDSYKYYVIGPDIRRTVLFDKETDTIVSYFTDYEYNGKTVSGVYEMPHERMEIPEEQYNNLLEVLPSQRVKEEQVVKEENIFLYGI